MKMRNDNLAKNRFLMLLVMMISLFLPACNRHKQIMAEKDAVEAESQRVWAEYIAYEQKIKSLGTQGTQLTMTLENQATNSERAAAFVEQEVNVLIKWVIALEGAIAIYRPKVDAYKARYTR